MLSHKNILFEPLSNALQSVQLWLSRNGASRLMVAAPTIAAMKRQDLPDHIKVTPQKRRGPRVRVHNTHFMERRRTILARWPEDGMEEYIMPMLACVIGGEADLLIANYVLHCHTGDIIFFPAGIPKCNAAKPHLMGNTTGRSCDLLWITPAVHTTGFHCHICHSANGQHPLCVANEQCYSRNLFLERLFEEFSEELQQRGKKGASMEMLTLFIRLLKREIDEDVVFPSPYNIPEGTSASPSRDPIEQACLYIDSHLELRLTIGDVARHVYLSPTPFTRRFREHTGQSFKEYLTAERMKKAIQLLQETDMVIDRVSYCVGLKKGQLRNLFIEKYGYSPAEFRKRYLSP
jgi:AraC-like DNA-binding protein